MQLKKHKNSPYLKAIFFTFLVVSTGFLIFNGLNSLQLTGNPMAGGEYVETCVNKKCSGDCYISYCPSHGSESCCQAYCPGESWCGSSSGSGSGSSTSTTTLSNAVSGGAYVTTCGSDQCVNLVKNGGTLNLEYNNSCLVIKNNGSVNVNFFVPAVSKSDFLYFITYPPYGVKREYVSCDTGTGGGYFFDLDSEDGPTTTSTGGTSNVYPFGLEELYIQIFLANPYTAAHHGAQSPIDTGTDYTGDTGTGDTGTGDTGTGDTGTGDTGVAEGELSPGHQGGGFTIQ